MRFRFYAILSLISILQFVFAEQLHAQLINANAWRTAPTSTPLINYDFVASSSIPAGATFSRASSGLYYNSTGVLQTAASNVARFDYDPVSSTLRGLLMEPAATNLAPNGSSFTTGYYTVRATISSDSTVKAPDGVSNSNKITEATGSGDHQFGMGLNLTQAASTEYTASLYVRPGPNITIVEAIINNRAGTYAGCRYQLTGSGSIYSTNYAGVITNCKVQQVGNGWYRVTYTYNTGTGSTGITPHFKHVDSTLGVNYDPGSRAYYYHAWGFQTELGPTATSYIPTAGGAASRSADILTIGSLSSWYDRAVGTLFAQYINAGTESVSNYPIFGLVESNVAGTFSPNMIMLQDSGTTHTSVVNVSGSAVYTASGAINAAATVNKVALAYDNRNFAFTTNGSTASPQLSGALPTAAAYAYVGSQPDGVARPRWIQKIRYYRQRISNPALKTLTQ